MEYIGTGMIQVDNLGTVSDDRTETPADFYRNNRGREFAVVYHPQRKTFKVYECWGMKSNHRLDYRITDELSLDLIEALVMQKEMYNEISKYG